MGSGRIRLTGTVMSPEKMIDANQAWFWTRGWQEGELKASAELAAGKGTVYKTDQAFLAALEENRRRLPPPDAEATA